MFVSVCSLVLACVCVCSCLCPCVCVCVFLSMSLRVCVCIFACAVVSWTDNFSLFFQSLVLAKQGSFVFDYSDCSAVFERSRFFTFGVFRCNRVEIWIEEKLRIEVWKIDPLEQKSEIETEAWIQSCFVSQINFQAMKNCVRKSFPRENCGCFGNRGDAVSRTVSV